MPSQFLQIVSSSDPAAPLLSAEIAQAFAQIRERAHQIYLERIERAAPGDAVGDWLRAERELFAVPDAGISDEQDLWRLALAVDPELTLPTGKTPPIRLLVTDGGLTLLGSAAPAEGAPALFCHLDLPGLTEEAARGARLLRRGEALIEIALPKPVASEPEPASGAAASTKRKTRASAATATASSAA